LQYPFRHSSARDNISVVEKDEEKLIIEEYIQEQNKEQNQTNLYSKEDEFTNLPTMEYGSVATDTIVLETDANGRSPRLELRRTGVPVQKKATKDTIKTPFTPQPVISQPIATTPVVNKASQYGVSQDIPVCVSKEIQIPVVKIVRTIVQGDTSHLLEIIQSYKATQRGTSEIYLRQDILYSNKYSSA